LPRWTVKMQAMEDRLTARRAIVKARGAAYRQPGPPASDAELPSLEEPVSCAGASACAPLSGGVAVEQAVEHELERQLRRPIACPDSAPSASLAQRGPQEVGLPPVDVGRPSQYGPGMELSTRNRLKAKVRSVKLGDIMAEVTLDVGGQEIVSVMSPPQPRGYPAPWITKAPIGGSTGRRR
jgi:hypothetical protein